MQMLNQRRIDRLPTGWIPADSFSNRLVVLRRDLNLTIDEVAELTGISPATWSNWERGATPMKIEKIVAKIAEKTKVDPEWLALGFDQNLKEMRRLKDWTRPAEARPRDREVA
jgi:transcriptional regulator with XRE-family HTH domain